MNLTKILSYLIKPPLRVIIKTESLDLMPTKGTMWSAGYDLKAAEDVELAPGKTRVVSAGFQMILPLGTEAQIRPRSGMSLKTSLRIANSPGTIDADYHLDVGVIITNTGNDLLRLKRGDRFAQMVIHKLPETNLVEVSNTEWEEELAKRNQEEANTYTRVGGYGSTGN